MTTSDDMKTPFEVNIEKIFFDGSNTRMFVEKAFHTLDEANEFADEAYTNELADGADPSIKGCSIAINHGEKFVVIINVIDYTDPY